MSSGATTARRNGEKGPRGAGFRPLAPEVCPTRASNRRGRSGGRSPGRGFRRGNLHRGLDPLACRAAPPPQYAIDRERATTEQDQGAGDCDDGDVVLVAGPEAADALGPLVLADGAVL